MGNQCEGKVASAYVFWHVTGILYHRRVPTKRDVMRRVSTHFFRFEHLTMSLSQQQVAGHLGVANNPQCSSHTKHASRQAVAASAAKGSSGRSQSSIAGQIGVTTNPQMTSSNQHSARVGVMSAASHGGGKSASHGGGKSESHGGEKSTSHGGGKK